VGSEERRVRDKQRVRVGFLDAARNLLVTEGFEALTIRRVADVTEYSAAAIYTHFADKDSLVRELCSHDFAVFTESLKPVATIQDPSERLTALARNYARFAIEHPQHYRLLFLTPRPSGATIEEGRGNPERDAYALLEAAVRYAIDQGMFPQLTAHAPLVAQTLWAGMHGVVALELVMAGDDLIAFAPLEQRVHTMAEALLIGMVGVAASVARAPATSAGVARRTAGARPSMKRKPSAKKASS
jgi:AcrR family transcriptional regulator